MERQDSAPERTDHSILHRAYADASSLPERWRQRYGLPLTDPRWLKATEEDIIDDMLRCMFFDAKVRRATNPTGEIAAAMETDASGFAEVDEKIRAAFGPDGAIGKLLALGAKKAEPRKITTIRMAGRVVTGG